MRSEHRAPFIASIAVSLACAGVMVHAVRTDALGGLARLIPASIVASTLVTHETVPAPVAAPAPAVPATPATPAAPATRSGSHARPATPPSATPATPASPAKPHRPARPAAVPAATAPAPLAAPTIVVPTLGTPAVDAAGQALGHAHGASVHAQRNRPEAAVDAVAHATDVVAHRAARREGLGKGLTADDGPAPTKGSDRAHVTVEAKVLARSQHAR